MQPSPPQMARQLPFSLQQALNPANESIADIEKLLQGADVQARIVDAAVQVSKASSGIIADCEPGGSVR
jgi:ATP-dependent helicase STH1/SNF2